MGGIMEKKIIIKKLLTNPKVIMLLTLILFSLLSVNVLADSTGPKPGEPITDPDPATG